MIPTLRSFMSFSLHISLSLSLLRLCPTNYSSNGETLWLRDSTGLEDLCGTPSRILCEGSTRLIPFSSKFVNGWWKIIIKRKLLPTKNPTVEGLLTPDGETYFVRTYRCLSEVRLVESSKFIVLSHVLDRGFRHYCMFQLTLLIPPVTVVDDDDPNPRTVIFDSKGGTTFSSQRCSLY